MNGTLRLSRSARRSTRLVRRLVLFTFARINRNQSVVTNTIQLRNLINNGEVIVNQRPATGSVAQPIVRYQFVNATTGVPVSNAVTVTGTRTVILPFRLPSGNVRLRITNIGAGPVAVRGVVLVF